MRLACIVVGLSFAVSALAADKARVIVSDAGPASIAADAVDRVLVEAMRQKVFVGAATVVVADGRVIAIRTYGSTQAGKTDAMLPSTVFNLASVSKGFSATTAAVLDDKRQLSLDAPVRDYVEGFALQNESKNQYATLATVLGQRSGLPPNAYDNILEARRPISGIWTKLSEVPTLCATNACYSYQNVAFQTIVPAIETATAKPFQDSMGSLIFEPLGMKNASVGADALAASDSWARPHKRAGIKSPWKVRRHDHAYFQTSAAGGVNASAEDMGKWLMALLGHSPEVVSDNVRARLFEPTIRSQRETRKQRRYRARIKDSWYGLGFRIYDYAGERMVGHAGSAGGYRAQIALLPDHDVGIAVLWNTLNKEGAAVAPTFLDSYLALPFRDWMELGLKSTNG